MKSREIFQAPDFAFPKTVAENSEKNLDNALHTQSPVPVLRALMDLTIARDLISKENVVEQINLIDSVSNMLEAPYNSIALMIEAELYREIYNADRFTYNNRVVPSENFNRDPRFWNRDIFKSVIDSLCVSALDIIHKNDRDISLKHLKGVVDLNNSEKILTLSDFTVTDFIIYKVIDISSEFAASETIPFFEKPNAERNIDAISLLDNIISAQALKPSMSLAYAIYRKYKIIESEENKRYLLNNIEKYSDYELSAPLLAYYYDRYISYSDNNDDILEFANLMFKVKENVKSEKLATLLKNIESALSRESATLDSPGLVTTGREFTIDIKTKNLNRFYLLIYRAGNAKVRELTKDKISKNLKSVARYELNNDAPRYCISTDTVNLSLPEPGNYYLFVSKTGKPEDVFCTPGNSNNVEHMRVAVSDIDLITTSAKGQGGCYVVDAVTSKPISGAQVTFKETYLSNNYKTVSTNSDGLAVSPFKESSISAKWKGSEAESNVYAFNRESGNIDNNAVRLFTDLAVYRPGDTVNFFGITYTHNNFTGEICHDVLTICELRDANYQVVDTVQLISDASGRIFGSFKLPKDGLLGDWQIVAFENIGKATRVHNTQGYVNFSVAEYKTPSFIVAIEKKEGTPGFAVFEGSARTYSGMPVAHCKVYFDVEFHKLWFFNSDGSKSYSSSVTTDSEGNFEIKLPLQNIESNDYRRGIFNLNARVTDSAGETVVSNTVPFWIQETYTIEAQIPDRYNVDSEMADFKVKLVDQTGMQVAKKIAYEIWADNKKIAEGSFMSPRFEFETKDLPSGLYTFAFKCADNEQDFKQNDAWQKFNCILYRSDDKQPPVETVLWVPETRIVADPKSSKAQIKYGSSYIDQSILCSIETSAGEISSQWLQCSKSMETIAVDAPHGSERTRVTFIACRNHNIEILSVEIVPYSQTEQLEIVTETFRNNLSPGDKEQWRFLVKKAEYPAEANIYAVMYDRALDAIAPLFWNTTLFTPRYAWNNNFSYPFNSGVSFTFINTRIKNINPGLSIGLNFNTYGQRLYPSCTYRTRMVMTDGVADDKAFYKMETQATNALMAKSAFVEDAVEEVATEGSAGQSLAEDVELRPIEMPLAFFKPNLSTVGDSGDVVIDFTVPNFNTTWKLLLGAYTTDLKSAVTSLEAVASKKVMVRMLAPRFLRTGDKATLAATLYNNSDSELEINGRYEIFNPLTNEKLQEINSEAYLLGPGESHVFSIEYEVKAEINVLGLRAYALTTNHSDGEQTIIPVLPSSQPVIESTVWYLAADQEEFSIKLPKFNDDARLTLSYCDNPTWEALLALAPVIVPQSDDIISQITAFYANSVSHGLMLSNPSLRRGLEMIIRGEAGDSLLISNLEKDADLKTVTLNNTPWVNNAANETLMLSRLSSLLDDKEAEKAIKDNFDKITKYRKSDGGFSWCMGMESSLYITQSVLINIGLLKGAGYLDYNSEIEEIVRSAIEYCEKNITEGYNKYKDKNDYPYLTLQQFLFIRGFFPEIRETQAFQAIKNKAVDVMSKKWKETSIFDKATLAIILWREKREMAAREILESLKQFAVETPEKGMWFDNLDSYWGSANKQLATARTLMAFQTVSPADPAIDKMRQWLLLQRQSQDFKESLFSVDAIDALLTTGNSWDGEYGKPEIVIGDMTIGTSEISSLTGSCKIDISVKEASDQELKIRRKSPSPAWGGVIEQYVAPIESIKDASIPGLTINKEIWKVVERDNVARVEKADNLKIGDKLRISLIIDVDRDMDFVTLVDERSACLEPADQLSGYDVLDGLWCYHETRNNATNLYFSFLPKGRHIITYDCYVIVAGEFASGIATIQCLYSPLLTAHSAGRLLIIK